MLVRAAIWFGLLIANRLVTPIGEVVSVAERIRAGDLTARVTEQGDDDEIATLGRTFNRMTGQLAAQQSELIAANRQLDERRRENRRRGRGSSNRRRSWRLSGDHRGDTTRGGGRSEEHTSELQSRMRNSYAVFCLKKKKKINNIAI